MKYLKSAKRLFLAFVVSMLPMFGMVEAANATTSQIATDTISLIQSYGADAVLIVAAMILAVWALKALGLFKRG